MATSKSAEAGVIDDISMTEIELKEEGQSEAKQADVWAVTWDEDENQEKWSDKSTKQKMKSVAVSLIKLCVVLGCLYLFICSISLLGDAFQILAGKTAGEIFGNDSFLNNPISGLILGVLVTVLIQSSSTSTSIVVSMVASNILSVDQAVYIIMGSNIGTSVTNTIVSLTQSVDREEFRRAFAGATVLDVFNLLTVLVLLPLEVVSGYLVVLTEAIVTSFNIQGGANAPDLLKVLTEPLVGAIVHINKTIITLTAEGVPLPPEASMIKVWCKQENVIVNVTELKNVTESYNSTSDEAATMVTEMNVTSEQEIKVGLELCKSPNDFLFANTGLSDVEVGAILLVMSLIILCTCLIIMVKVLNSMMHGGVSVIIKKVINTNFKYPFGWLTGYLAMMVGAGLTFVFQSSSVFTSTLTPLVGIGVVSLKRMYPLSLGANIGTTTTGILSALASDGSGLQNALQIALVHLFFNITGILIWYPIPFMRVPIRGAKALGNTTAKYRWFAVLYVICVFFLIPIILLALSFAHVWALLSVVIVVVVIAICIVVVNLLQTYRPQWLPRSMRTWHFLPVWMRSFEPYDEVFSKYLLCCCKEANKEEEKDLESISASDTSEMPSGCDNSAFEVSVSNDDKTTEF